jgi:hypothetical protein
MDEGIPIREMVSRICESAQCSARTLYKNKDLWHPDHLDRDRPAKGVTPHQAEDITDPAEQQRLIREGIGNPDEWGVTGNGGDNEVWNVKSLSLKNVTPQGKEGGCGARGMHVAALSLYQNYCPLICSELKAFWYSIFTSFTFCSHSV